ncbi:MAG TPA: hypothetical protein PLC53_04000, partial [Bacilli bacterium]|nr:hypothetical protein [Bacilli bacterium]
MKIGKYRKIYGSKYEVYIDNKTYKLYEDVILKYNLLYKTDIDKKLFDKIIEDNYNAEIYDVALKYISVRMHSIKEVTEYLKNKNYNTKDINLTISELLSKN